MKSMAEEEEEVAGVYNQRPVTKSVSSSASHCAKKTCTMYDVRVK